MNGGLIYSGASRPPSAGQSLTIFGGLRLTGCRHLNWPHCGRLHRGQRKWRQPPFLWQESSECWLAPETSFAGRQRTVRSDREHYFDLRSPAAVRSGRGGLGDHSSGAGVPGGLARDLSEAALGGLQAGARGLEGLAE